MTGQGEVNGEQDGKGARVCQYHESLDKTHETIGLLAMREDDRGHLVMCALNGADGKVTPGLMNRLSRTPPVLAETNISAMTAVIPSSRVDLFGYAWFAVFHAGKTVYVPLYLGSGATPGS